MSGALNQLSFKIDNFDQIKQDDWRWAIAQAGWRDGKSELSAVPIYPEPCHLAFEKAKTTIPDQSLVYLKELRIYQPGPQLYYKVEYQDAKTGATQTGWVEKRFLLNPLYNYYDLIKEHSQIYLRVLNIERLDRKNILLTLKILNNPSFSYPSLSIRLLCQNPEAGRKKELLFWLSDPIAAHSEEVYQQKLSDPDLDSDWQCLYQSPCGQLTVTEIQFPDDQAPALPKDQLCRYARFMYHKDQQGILRRYEAERECLVHIEPACAEILSSPVIDLFTNDRPFTQEYLDQEYENMAPVPASK